MVENETRIHISNTKEESVKEKAKKVKPKTKAQRRYPTSFLPNATLVKVYGLPMSTTVSKVLDCLYEKNFKCQLISINISKGEHKKPNFLKIQVRSEKEIALNGKESSFSLLFSDYLEIDK